MEMEMEMDGKSNDVTKVAKEDPSLSQAMALMEGNNCSNGSDTKEGGDNRLDGEGVIVKKQNVAMAMGTEFLDFPISFAPLSPPVFQTKANKVWGVCSRDVSTRCHDMERVVDSIIVRGSYVVHGCGDTIAYHKKRAHEEHEWPTTRFQYYKAFDVPVKASVHVLRGGEDGHPFLLHVVPLDSTPLHGVSLGHYQASTLDTIRSTSLSDRLPTNYFLTVPKACRGGGARVVLSVTIDTEMVYGDDDELEEENEDDESCNKEEDEDEDSDEDEDNETSDEDDESYNNKEEEEEEIEITMRIMRLATRMMKVGRR
uniref:Uncharacterized protein n=1 Tax=Triticum aestivum TaxID=4565 RepID=A0A077RPL4_WHEAT|nr:unnamed protein product [Triticum aestivum]